MRDVREIGLTARLQKQQQQKDANAEGAGQKKKKVTAAQLRVQKGPLCAAHHLPNAPYDL